MGNPKRGECLAVGCDSRDPRPTMFCDYHSATPEEIGRLRDRIAALESELAVVTCNNAILRPEINRQDTELAKARKDSERRRDLLERAYRAVLKPDWEEGECIDEMMADIRWEAIDEPKMLKEHAAREGESDAG